MTGLLYPIVLVLVSKVAYAAIPDQPWVTVGAVAALLAVVTVKLRQYARSAHF